MSKFFKSIKKNIHKKVANVSTKSYTAIESSKIKGYISNLEEQRDVLICELGKKIYQLSKKNELDLETIEENCDFIKEFDRKIDLQFEKLRLIKLEEQEILNSYNKKPQEFFNEFDNNDEEYNSENKNNQNLKDYNSDDEYNAKDYNDDNINSDLNNDLNNDINLGNDVGLNNNSSLDNTSNNNISNQIQCIACSKLNNSNSNFCFNCGTKLEEDFD